MKKRVLAMLISGLMVMSLAACGGGSSSGDSADEGGEEGGISGDLVVYSSAPEADNESLEEGFNEIYPDVNIEFVQGNQGEGIARVQAEADAPTIDVFYTGINDTDGDTYKDLFEEYVSPSNEDLEEQYQSNGYYNYNMVSTVCICVNTELAEELGVEIKGYNDLTNPALAGKVVMSDPAESSSAWNNVCNLFTIYGNDADEAWDLLKALLDNDLVVTSSSSVCFNDVQAGEYVAGITYEGGPIELLANGADNIEIVYPEEGISGSIFASAIIKDAPHMEAAKALVDWLTSKDGQQTKLDLGSPQRHCAADLDFSNSAVPELDQPLLARDSQWLVDNKEAMVEKWTELYTQYQ